MGEGSDTRFLVLHGLRLKGFGEPANVAAAVGLDEQVVADHLAKLQADDVVLRRDGRLSGFALTTAGRAEQERLAKDDLAATGALAAVEAVYGRFLELNGAFKQLCTDWQVRDGSLYDHGDAAYNATVFGRLRALHDRLGPLLDELASVRPRFAVYRGRFTTAIDGLEGGDLDLLTKPLVDSYHTIWFELHEDLLTGLGIDRSQEGSY